MRTGRIAQVVPTKNFAGVERYVADVSCELSLRGWDVTVIGGDPAAMHAAMPPDIDVIEATGVTHAVRALRLAGRQDIVHTHMTAAEVAGTVVSTLRGDTLVTTRHFARPRGASRLGRAARPLIGRRVSAQLAISQYVADRIDGASELLHSGASPSELGSRPRGRTVIMLQRLELEKQTRVGIEAWALSGLAGDGWHLEIYGTGSQEKSLRELTRRLGVEDSVSFGGFEPAARERLAGAGILLAPTEVEGFGLTVVEAMAEGTPVVAAAAGAHLETLGSDAALFEPGSAADAAERLRCLAGNEAHRRAYGQRLQSRYEAQFTLTRHVDRLEEIYQDAISRRLRITR